MQIRLLGNIPVVSAILVSVLIAFTQKASTTPDHHDLTQLSATKTSPCANGKESGLPLPSRFLPAKLSEFQGQLKSFLTSGKYRSLNWCEDKSLRDTGPFINGVTYGVHPTVKIYYSPDVIKW